MKDFLKKYINIPLSLNYFLEKKIDIGTDLSCIILIDSKNEKILKPLLNKITDYLFDNLNPQKVYDTFLVSLESINFFLKNLEKKENFLDDLNIFIWVNYKTEFYFSKIWNVSCYIINSSNEFIELTQKSKKWSFFDYISSWTLKSNEKIIISNNSLNDYFTSEDIKDVSLAWSLENTLEVLEKIIKEEEKENSIFLWIFSLWLQDEQILTDKKSVNINFKNIFYKLLDCNFFKKIYAYFWFLSEKLNIRSKKIRIFVSIIWIILSTFLLYNIIYWVIWVAIKSNKLDTAKMQLIEAREYLRLANQNISNPDIFDINIKKVEEIISQLKNEKLFLADVDSIENDLSIIKKQFNWVEIFSMDSMNILFWGDFSGVVKFLNINKKWYLVFKDKISWPFIQWQKSKDYVFSELDLDDEFVDASVSWDNIILTTKKNRVISFSSNTNTFKYINVIWQQAWEWIDAIELYNSNLYVLNSNQNQIYKHTPASWNYTAWISYLKEDDSKNIWKIVSIWIDWGIYLLKDDLTIVKFFSSPYRLENIVLNKLPKNYNKENWKKVYLYVKPDLNLVYMFLNNKIFIFKPNTKLFRDTKSLTYLWQIEWKDQDILAFNVLRDWEIHVVSSKWIYKLNFEENEDKIILR